MRCSLAFAFASLLSACGSTTFTSGDGGGGDGGDAATSVCATKHDLCDDFDVAGETAGGPPWSLSTGAPAIQAPGRSAPNALFAGTMPSSSVTWTLPRLGGVVCQGALWLETAPKALTVAVVDVVVPGAGNDVKVAYTITIDTNQVAGVNNKPGTTLLDTWGTSATALPVGAWLPFRIAVTFGASQYGIQANVGSAALNGSPMSPGKPSVAHVSFGAIAPDAIMTPMSVRWDDVFCDATN